MTVVFITPAPRGEELGVKGEKRQQAMQSHRELPILEKHGSISGDTFRETHLVLTINPMRTQTHIIYYNVLHFK